MNKTENVKFFTEVFMAAHEENPGDLHTQLSMALWQIPDLLRLLGDDIPKEDIEDLIYAFRSCLSRDYGGFNNPW